MIMREDEFKVGDRVITTNGNARVPQGQIGTIERIGGLIRVRMDEPECTTRCVEYGYFQIDSYEAHRFLSRTGPKKKRKTGFGKFASSKFPDTNQIGT